MSFCRALVVYRENGAAGRCRRVFTPSTDIENVHAIVLVTDAPRPVVGFGSCIGVRWDATVKPIAGGVKDANCVAAGYAYLVGDALGYC